MKRRSPGEGSIFFDDTKGLWVARITLEDGNRKSKSNKKQSIVKEWLLKMRSAKRDGVIPKDENMTISIFLNRYLADVARPNLRPKTLESYASLIKHHILPELGKLKVSQLRPDDLQSLYRAKLESGLSKRTVHYIHSIIHKVLNQALRWGMVVRNVADLVDAPRPSKRPPTIWNRDQVEKFFEFVRGDRFEGVYALTFYGGLREGEALAVGVEDCNLENGLVTVNKAVQYQIGHGVVITPPKTEGSKRSVKLPEVALTILRRYISQLNRNQGLLFTTDSGKPVSPRFLVKCFKRTIKEIGLPEIRFYDSRHSHNSLLLMAGVHPKIVQERNGHSSITLTMDTYSHIIPGIQDSASEELDKMFTRP